MSAAAAGLKRLHELHIRLQELQQQLEHGPRQVKARQQIVAAKQARSTRSRPNSSKPACWPTRRTCSSKPTKARSPQLEAKLNQATSNREFDIIRSQIDADTMANSVLEDEILEVLEKVDQLQQKIKQAEEEVAPGGRRSPPRRPGGRDDGPEAAIPGDGDGSGASRGRENSPRRPRWKCIADSCRPTEPVALATVEDNSCTACIEILSANSLVELNTGKFMFCRSCGRLLYRPEAD